MFVWRLFADGDLKVA